MLGRLSVLAALVLVAIPSTRAFAQSGAGSPAFEVASIRPTAEGPDSRTSSINFLPGGRFVAINRSLSVRS